MKKGVYGNSMRGKELYFLSQRRFFRRLGCAESVIERLLFGMFIVPSINEFLSGFKSVLD